jgi:hypothetical protein
MISSNEPDNDLDLAAARRLRRLADAPVDLASLESCIGAAIPRPGEMNRRKLFPRPYLAAAASVGVIVLVTAAVMLSAPRPVVASTEMLTDLYAHTDAMMVDPATASQMPCCVRKVEGRNVTCVSLDVAGKRVMMTVGEGKHFKVPDSAGRKVVGGVEYRFQSSGSINMVMTVRDGAWICLMGEPSVDELISRLEAMDHTKM